MGGDNLSNSGSKIGTEVEVVKVKERLFSLVCVGVGNSVVLGLTDLF